MRRLSAILCLLACTLLPAWGEGLPNRFTASEASALPGESQKVKGETEALLLTPADTAAATDPLHGGKYPAVCYVNLSESGLYVRRFAVHVQSKAGLTEAKRAGRFLALIWGCMNRRYGTLAERLRKTTVDVWLTNDGQAGGEHFDANLYLYDINTDRIPLEWARELAHEYGHYMLPGASGYTDPENWSNGVLGERLFLKWLGDDVRSGALPAGELAYVKPADLDEYRAKQVTPLIQRVAKAGIDIALLKQKDRRAMDAYTSLMLYADERYGGTVLLDLLDYLPPDGGAGASAMDFLSAFMTWAARVEEFTTALPDGESMLYLPRASYRVSGRDLKSLSGDKGTTVARTGEDWTIRVTVPGWHMVRAGGARSLSWHKL